MLSIVRKRMSKQSELNANEQALFSAVARRDCAQILRLCAVIQRDKSLGVVDCRNNNGKTPLEVAILGGNKEAVEALLQGGAQIYAKSALEFACRLQSDDILKFFLAWLREHKKQACRSAALRISIMRGDLSKADLLCQDEYRYCLLSRNEDKVLHVAVESKNVRCVEWAIERKFPMLNVKDCEIVDAVKGGDTRIISLIINYGGDFDGHHSFLDSPQSEARKEYYTALLWAVRFGTYGVVKLLLESGASVSKCVSYNEKGNSKGLSVLDLAVERGDCNDIIKLLVQYGARQCGSGGIVRIIKKNEGRNHIAEQINVMSSPLQRVFYNAVTGVRRLDHLYKNGHIAFPENENNICMVLDDVMAGVISVESFLLRSNANLYKSLRDVWMKKLNDLFCGAVREIASTSDNQKKNFQVIRVCYELLVKISGQKPYLNGLIDRLPGDNNSKLFVLAENGCVAIVQRLLGRDKSLCLGVQDEFGSSLLMKAVLVPSLGMVRYLLQQKVQVNAKDEKERTALQLLMSQENLIDIDIDKALILLDSGAEIDYLSCWAGKLLVLLAGCADKRAMKYIEIMLQQGVDRCSTIVFAGEELAALEMAVMVKNSDVVELLFRYDVYLGFDGAASFARREKLPVIKYFERYLKRDDRLFVRPRHRWIRNIADLYKKGKIEFPTNVRDIRLVLQDYHDGFANVYSFLTHNRAPASFEPLNAWVGVLQEFAINNLEECGNREPLALMLLSRISCNNEHIVPILKNARELGSQYICKLYCGSFLPIPVNEHDFLALVGYEKVAGSSEENNIYSNDSELCPEEVWGFLYNNATELQDAWRGETTLVAFLLSQYEVRKDIRVLLVLESIDPLDESFQELVSSWRGTAEKLIWQPIGGSVDILPDDKDALANLSVLYLNGKIKVPETRNELERCFKDMQSIGMHTDYFPRVYDFLEKFFKDDSVGKCRLLCDIGCDEKVKDTFVKAVRTDCDRSQCYISLLRALKPGWWKVSPGKRRGKVQCDNAVTRGEVFERCISEIVTSNIKLRSEASLHVEEAKGDDGTEKVEFKDGRPQAFIDAFKNHVVSEEYLCPITLSVMYDPVWVKTEYYERSAILEYYAQEFLRLSEQKRSEDVLLPVSRVPFNLDDICGQESQEKSAQYRRKIFELAGYKGNDNEVVRLNTFLLFALPKDKVGGVSEVDENDLQSAVPVLAS